MRSMCFILLAAIAFQYFNILAVPELNKTLEISENEIQVQIYVREAEDYLSKKIPLRKEPTNPVNRPLSNVFQATASGSTAIFSEQIMSTNPYNGNIVYYKNPAHFNQSNKTYLVS